MNTPEDLDRLISFINNLINIESERLFKDNVLVFYFNKTKFIIIDDNKIPIKISLICDYKLNQLLQAKYDEVIPAINVDQKKWITVLLTGQMKNSDLEDLIRHAYQQVQQSS